MLLRLEARLVVHLARTFDPVAEIEIGQAQLAAALDQGHPLQIALMRASVAAGLACTQVGAQTSQPSAAEIDARLSELTVAATLG